jgi:hypothetical protein
VPKFFTGIRIREFLIVFRILSPRDVSVADPKKIFFRFGFGSKKFFSDSDTDSDFTQVVKEI